MFITSLLDFIQIYAKEKLF